MLQHLRTHGKRGKIEIGSSQYILVRTTDPSADGPLVAIFEADPLGLIDRDEVRIDPVIDIADPDIFMDQPGPEVQWIARRLLRDVDAAGYGGLGACR